jgi:hypothetical protein
MQMRGSDMPQNVIGPPHPEYMQPASLPLQACPAVEKPQLHIP